MELEILVTISLAICCGLFYLANQLPKFYKLVWGYLLGFCFVVSSMAFGYSQGIVASYKKVFSDWDAGQPDTNTFGKGVTFALKSLSEMDGMLMFTIAGVALGVVVIFFRFLPTLKQVEQEK